MATKRQKNTKKEQDKKAQVEKSKSTNRPIYILENEKSTPRMRCEDENNYKQQEDFLDP